ncbi:MAG: tetratricopeptide repeat protein [Pirellulaceae bacterium]
MNSRFAGESPHDSPWTVYRSRALDAMAARRWSEAGQALSEALVLAPRRELAELYALRAFLHVQADELGQAIDDASACLGEDPDNSEALWWRGIALAQQEKWDEAIADLSRAERLSEGHQRALREWLEQAVARAVESWKHREAGETPSGQDFARRASWLLTIGELDRAERDLAEAGRLSPELPLVFRGRTELARQRRRWNDARIACDRWLELEPSSREALLAKAQLLIDAGERPAALGTVAELEERSGGSVAELLELVRLWRRAGDRLRALYWCERANEQLGGRFPVLLLRGQILMELRCWRSAAEQWRAMIGLRPESLYERIQLGRCLVKLRRFDDATRCFEEASALGPTFADVHAGLAHARWAARDPSGARAAADRALRLDTTHLAGRVITAHLEMAAGRIDYGLKLLGEAWKRAEAERRVESEWLGECAYAEGVGWLERGETQRAIERFDAALGQRGDHPGTWVWRAKAWARLGRLDACRSDLMTAARLNPSCHTQYTRLGQELARDFLTVERVRMSDDASDEQRQFQKIVALEMSGDEKQAWRLYRRVAKRLPTVSEQDVRLLGEAETDSGTGGSNAAVPRWEWELLKLRLSRRQGPHEVETVLQAMLRDSLELDQVLSLVDTVEPEIWGEERVQWLEEQALRFPNSGRLARRLGVVFHRSNRPGRAARVVVQGLVVGRRRRRDDGPVWRESVVSRRDGGGSPSSNDGARATCESADLVGMAWRGVAQVGAI